MKTKIISAIILLSFLIGSCKKSDPVVTQGNLPVFSFSGTINGAPVSLQAGVNNYYMFTSYALDGNGIYDFTGELKNQYCTSNCSTALKISIKDYRQYSIAPTNIDTSIAIGYYSFATPTGAASRFYVQFKDTMYNGTGQTYHWDFGDGTTSGTHLPTHVFSHPGIYNVSLTMQTTGGCTSSLSNSTVVGQAGNAILFAYGSSTTGNTVGFSASVGGGLSPYTLNWDFGDGNTAITTSPTYTIMHNYASPGVYATALTVTDAANTTAVGHLNAATQNVTTCHMNFYPMLTTPVPNQTNLADVTIEWRDANGLLYTSANNSQSSKSMFKIISVDNYQNNSNGQSTKKIHAKATCTLYNGTSSVTFEGDIIFAVAHL